MALEFEHVVLPGGVLPRLTGLELNGLVDVLLRLRIEIGQIVIAKPVKVVDVHWLISRNLIPSRHPQVQHCKPYAEVQMGKLNLDFVHANVKEETGCGDKLDVD
jgi:hypothetical protein